MSGEEMRCAVQLGPGRIEVRTRHVPEPREGEVLIRVAEVGICGGDLHGFRGDARVVGPREEGEGRVVCHEIVGTVVESRDPGMAAGTRVVVEPHVYCGRCEYCERGFQELCLNRLDMGNKGPANKTIDGACAEFIRMPGRNCYPLPEGMPWDDGVGVHGLAAALHALERVPHRAGGTVAVLGGGAAGLYHLQLEQTCYAASVIAVARRESQLRLAERLGATPVDSTRADLVAQVRELTQGRGVDLVIDTTGSEALRSAAADLCARAGAILYYAPGPISLDGAKLARNELTIYASSGVTRTMKPSLDLVASGRVKTGVLISHRFPLEETQRGFELATGEQKGDYVKGAIVLS